VWWGGNWNGCGSAAIGIGVVEFKLVWVWRRGKWYGFSGAAVDMVLVERHLGRFVVEGQYVCVLWRDNFLGVVEGQMVWVCWSDN